MAIPPTLKGLIRGIRSAKLGEEVRENIASALEEYYDISDGWREEISGKASEATASAISAGQSADAAAQSAADAASAVRNTLIFSDDGDGNVTIYFAED